MKTFVAHGGTVQRAPDYVDARVLAASTPELHTVPTGATFVEMVGTVAFYVTSFDATTATDSVTNGTFASDTGWTKGTGWTIAAGVADSDGSQTGASLLEQTPTGTSAIVTDRTYWVTYTVTRSAGTITPAIGGTAGTARSSAATFAEAIVAGSDGTIAWSADADFIGTVDTVSVVPCAPLPAADITSGKAAELVPAGRVIQRYIPAVTNLSLVSSGTPTITLSFWSDVDA